MSALADLIRNARNSMRTRGGERWTQDDLAEAMGVTRGYIGQIETGLIKRPRPQYRARFLQVLPITEEQWLRATGELGPESPVNVADEIRRIAAIPDLDDQEAELEQLAVDYPEVVRAMESMALRRVREAFRPGRE